MQEALNNLFSDEDDKKKRGKKRIVYSKKLAFKPASFPSASGFFLATLFIGIGAFLIFASTVLPQLSRSAALSSVVNSVADFELTNEVNPGLFSTSNRKGDTIPSNYATYIGVSVLGDKLKNPKGAEQLAKQMQERNFDNNLENIQTSIVILTKLGLLNKDDQSTKFVIDKIYSQILSLQEQDSGFKLTKFRSPTVIATFTGFAAIEGLGKMEDFKKTDQFADAVKFVLSQQTTSGGFGDISGQNATIFTTYFAVKALMYDSDNDETARQLARVKNFVFSCAAADGGFNEKEVEFFEDMYETESKSTATLEGLYILFALAKANIVQSSLLSEWAQVVSKASSYVRGTLRGGNGVLEQYSSNLVDLRANFRFYELATNFDRFDYGSNNELKNLIAGVGALFIVFGIYNFYSDQITDKSTKNQVMSEIRTTSLFIIIAGITLYFAPKFAIVPYIILLVYVGTKFYKYVGQDKTGGELVLSAFVNAMFYFLLAALFNFTSEGASFTNPYIYYVMFGWYAATTFFTAYFSASLSLNRKPSHYIGVAYVGWVAATAIFAVYVSGRTTFSTAFNIILISGHFSNIFIVVPIISLVISYALSLVALAF